MANTTKKKRKYRKYPPHGTRTRYANTGPVRCRCVACTNHSNKAAHPKRLTWRMDHVVSFYGRERVIAWLGVETVRELEAKGLSDKQAEELCMLLGTPDELPEVFSGWYEAGEEIYVYP